MKNKVVDLTSYRIEKTLKSNGFIIKKDSDNNIMLLIKRGGDGEE